MKHPALLAILASIAACLPGCVVWEIRDEMRRTNAQVGAVQESLASTNQKLSGVDTQLTGTNERLSGTNERLQGTNSSLSGVEEQLALLREINASMGKLDTHLASLRKSIGAINNMMPFLGLDDVPAETDAAPAADAPEGAPAEPPKEGQPAQPRREVLVGVWVSAYPDRSRALIVTPDGKYLLSKPDAKGKTTVVERGAWKRGDKALTLQPDAAPPVLPIELLHATGKTFAVQDGAAVWVFVKP